MIDELNKRYKPLVWSERDKGEYAAWAENYSVSVYKGFKQEWQARFDGINLDYGYGETCADALDAVFNKVITGHQFQIDQVTRLFSVLKKQNEADNPNEVVE